MWSNRTTEPRTYGPIEAWTRTRVEMEPDHARELAAQGVVRVEVDRPPTSWWLQPDSRVGVITGDGWELRVDPRLRIPKLLFLLAYSARPDGWHDTVTRFGEEEDVLAAVASGFSWHATRALERGVLRGYLTVNERRPDIRGRIRFGDQIKQLPGMTLPIEVTYDDFTADILENRMLLTAAEILLQLPRIPPRARSRLLRTRVALDDVERLVSPADTRSLAITRLNARYASALALAELILRHRATTARLGDVRSTAFLFDLNEVFESFLTTALTESLRSYGGEVRPQFRDHLDEGGALEVKPDITWWRRGRCVAVVDAKYKSVSRGGSIPNADAYQMLAYCIAFGIPRGLLVYAKDENERARAHAIRRHGYTVEVSVVDVEAEPVDVLAQVGAIAANLAEDRS
jgi:5-methylcytosine-specific restriction enzyme subunit McrC